MADRLYSAQVDYPFVANADPQYAAGILDALFYLSPDDNVTAPAGNPGPIERVGAWLYSRDKVGTDYRYLFYVACQEDPDVNNLDEPYVEAAMRYTVRTFLVPLAPVGAIVTAIAAEDGRSVLVVNNGQLEGPDAYHVCAENYMEPAIVAPCIRSLTEIQLYNEYRSSNPIDRNSLPPDSNVATIGEGGSLVFNDGYNCAVSYDEDIKTLRFTGGIGYGKGRPTEIPWDDTTEDFEKGVRSINGANGQGTVMIDAARSVILDSSVPGTFRLIVRDQGDD